MPFTRFEQLDDEKRTTILETALDAFVENSFKVASINKISKNAGLSSGALYYYFQDKEDLFYTTLEYTSKVLWKHFGGINSIFEEYGYWEGITVIVLKRLELSLIYPKYMRLFQRVLLSRDEVELEGKSRLMQGFDEIFEYGYENGYIRKDLPKEFLFNMHFNMTITINEWILHGDIAFSDEDINTSALRELSLKGVDMIRAAMSKEK